MNDISYNFSSSDVAILREIGEFIKSRRMALDLTQEEVADRAAISRSTLSLAEHGENIALLNLLKILRVLDALHVFEPFRVEPQISPILLAKEDEKKRKRASRSGTKSSQEDIGW